MSSISVGELRRLEAYLRRRLNNPQIRIEHHATQKEMGEVFLGDEFFGTVYRDTEDGEITFDINITILQDDLEGS
ncbi:MAG: DUF3126 family protein [Alphaproteobacteria bacterium]